MVRNHNVQDPVPVQVRDHRIGLDNAMALCRATGVTLDYIYFGNSSALPYALAIEINKLETAGLSLASLARPE